MILTTYACGCINVCAEHLADLHIPATCTAHQTHPETVITRREGYIVQRRGRYLWTNDRPIFGLVEGWIDQEKLTGPNLGSVDVATLRPIGGRDRIEIL